MTRAASGAQRSGAAALNFRMVREDYAMVDDNLRSSFFVPRAPARWDRKRLWAGPPGASPPGSTVPHGPGDRTGKPLILLGSTVLFHSPSRDARAAVQPRVRNEDHQNHRTTELQNQREINQSLAGSAPVLRFRRHKQWAGYSPPVAATSIQPLFDGGAWRKFRGWLAPAAWASSAGRNGGFPRFFGGATGRVGMAMLESAPKSVVCQRVVRVGRKPARLTGGARRTPGGCSIAWTTPTPPIALLDLPSSLALTAFLIWADAQSRRCSTAWERAQTSNVKMGSGVSTSRLASGFVSGWARRANRDRRVGDRGVSGAASGRSSRTRTIAWEGGHVN